MQLHVVKTGSCGFFGESGVVQIAECMTFTKSQQLMYINQQKERYDASSEVAERGNKRGIE
jgi:hypothetical protein